MREFFPLSAKALDLKSLIIVILIYIAASVLSGIVFNLFMGILILGKVASIISQLIDLYCLAGIVVAIMLYFRIN